MLASGHCAAWNAYSFEQNQAWVVQSRPRSEVWRRLELLAPWFPDSSRTDLDLHHYSESTRIVRESERLARRGQPLTPCFMNQEKQPQKRPSRVNLRNRAKREKRINKQSKARGSRLRINVRESSAGVVLDLRELRARRQRILESEERAVVACGPSFPALMLFKNHSLAHNSVKSFLRQLLERYQDSLELITSSPAIGCLPAPEDVWLDQVSFSDSETFVDEEDWLMDVEHWPQEVLCVEDVEHFSHCCLGLSEIDL